jgi:hypothetical protein
MTRKPAPGPRSAQLRPMWDQLTGIKSNVAELSWPDLY